MKNLQVNGQSRTQGRPHDEPVVIFPAENEGDAARPLLEAATSAWRDGAGNLVLSFAADSTFAVGPSEGVEVPVPGSGNHSPLGNETEGAEELRCRVSVETDGDGNPFIQLGGVNCNLEGEMPGSYYLTPLRAEE